MDTQIVPILAVIGTLVTLWGLKKLMSMSPAEGGFPRPSALDCVEDSPEFAYALASTAEPDDTTQYPARLGACYRYKGGVNVALNVHLDPPEARKLREGIDYVLHTYFGEMDCTHCEGMKAKEYNYCGVCGKHFGG